MIPDPFDRSKCLSSKEICEHIDKVEPIFEKLMKYLPGAKNDTKEK